MLEDQPSSPEYEGDGCPKCGNENANGDIGLDNVEYDGDQDGVYVYMIWKCDACGHDWTE